MFTIWSDKYPGYEERMIMMARCARQWMEYDDPWELTLV